MPTNTGNTGMANENEKNEFPLSPEWMNKPQGLVSLPIELIPALFNPLLALEGAGATVLDGLTKIFGNIRGGGPLQRMHDPSVTPKSFPNLSETLLMEDIGSAMLSGSNLENLPFKDLKFKPPELDFDYSDSTNYSQFADSVLKKFKEESPYEE